MKTDIHPEYKLGMVQCACGNSFQVRSTVGDIKVEICSACHPFFTGKQKLVDSAGRVEKFMQKYGLGDEKKKTQKTTETPKKTSSEVEDKEDVVTEA